MSKLQEEARVIAQEPVAAQTYRLRLECPEIARAASAGQFVMLQVREGTDPLLRRPFSFHRIFAEEGAIEILYRVVGRGSWLLTQLQPGAHLSCLGPLGNGFRLPEALHRPVALVAGGIGIAPLMELIYRLAALRPDGGTGLHLFYGARTAAEFLATEPLEALGLAIHWSTDDGSRGYAGTVIAPLEAVARELKPAMLYACGPLAMQYHVGRFALAEHIPSQLSLESLMACGIGACLGCALPAPHPQGGDHYVHVCKDGPIFEAGAIQWNRIQKQQIPSPIFLFS